MKVSEVGLIIYYSLLCCAIHGSSNGQANAENILENNPESISNEDTPQFHSENHERRHLLAHLADRMDLDGEGLRHIQKHLGEVTGESIQNQDVNDVAAGDNAKGIFYFFKLHDYDDNQKLDGLEWMQALTDFHQQDDDKGEFKEGGRMFLEHEAEAIVDELLTKHDMDDDGMIDFFELMNSKVNSFMTDLDKGGEVPEGDEQQQQQNDEQKSSLEQELNHHQQDQQSKEQNQAQQEDKPQEHQQQQDQQGQQEHQQQQHQQQQDQQGQQEHQQQADQQQQDQQPQADQQQDQQEHQQQDNQQQEHNQQEPNSEEEQQGEQEQQDNEQQNAPSLDDEYNQQQQQQADQQLEHNQQEPNSEEPQGDQEQQDNPQDNAPSLEDEYNQQQQQ